MTQQRDLMGGLAKGLKVIEAFTAEHPRLSIADAAAITGLDRATARRCLLTLAELGYADYDGKYFTVTPRVLRLGTGCLAAMPLPRLVQPWLDTLSEEVGQSTSVSILDESEIVYVARAAQRRVMSINLMPGSRLPAFCTSMGRILLAALAPEDARRQRVEAQAQQRAAVVENEELHEEGRAADDLDIGLNEPADRTRHIALQQRDDEAERHAEDRAQEPAEDGVAEAGEQTGAVLLQDAPIHQIAVLCSR